jgi:Uma2 family endonuclease
MPRLIVSPDAAKRIIRRRRRLGLDRKDEVWDGVYVMAPDPNNLHQELSFLFAVALLNAMGGRENARVQVGGNVSDHEDKWTKNYRCPDVLVFLPGCPAEDRGSHYFGGPDFAIEVISPGDRSRKKLDFYAKVGVRELLLVDRNPWKLELYRLRQGKLSLVGVQGLDDLQSLRSEVLPVSFQLAPGQTRPEIVITREGVNGGVWTA